MRRDARALADVAVGDAWLLADQGKHPLAVRQRCPHHRSPIGAVPPRPVPASSALADCPPGMAAAGRVLLRARRVPRRRAARCVRVGTHALRASSSTLWGRLRAHRGTPAGGNHRGSVFRLHVGEALLNAGQGDATAAATWTKGSSAKRPTRDAEAALEYKVSKVIGAMSVLWVDVPDEPGPNSLRGHLERNAIALLSNHDRPPIDPPSPGWLGHHARASEIRSSGLWNVQHIAAGYDSAFLDELAVAVEDPAKGQPSYRDRISTAERLAAEEQGG